jgi:predicted phosphate transport protein (TIGR00153 family)
VAFRLIPRDVKFFDLFAASGQNLSAAAVKLRDLVADFDRLEDRIAEIQSLEKQGDKIDREISARLEESFVAPFDREDIHDLTSRLDDIVDFIQAVAESLVIYDVRQPTNEARVMAGLLATQATELAEALVKLESMKDVTANMERVHELEHQADGISRAAIGRLFRENHDPLEVIKWREIYLEMENAIDAAEDAAEAIERIVAKRV